MLSSRSSGCGQHEWSVQRPWGASRKGPLVQKGSKQNPTCLFTGRLEASLFPAGVGLTFSATLVAHLKDGRPFPLSQAGSRRKQAR